MSHITIFSKFVYFPSLLFHKYIILKTFKLADSDIPGLNLMLKVKTYPSKVHHQEVGHLEFGLLPLEKNNLNI
jgi:hypothetical protein